MTRKAKKVVAHPIPERFLKFAQQRKIDKGISIRRTVEDALNAALTDEVKKIWAQ